MRMLALSLAAFTFAVPTISSAADVDVGRRVAVENYYSDGGFYRGRGGYQDSGWAYEVPVYHDYRDCRERTIQTPSGINRIRQCPAKVVSRVY
jgi:hypothetical protein